MQPQAPSKPPESATFTEGTASTALSVEDYEYEDHEKHSKGVKFGNVHVHSHRLTLGDNPGVSVGVPLTLGWEVEDSEQFDLDTYEEETQVNNRSAVRRMTRHKRELIASRNHTRDSIVKHTEQVKDIQKSRMKSETDKAAKMIAKNPSLSLESVEKEKTSKKKKRFQFFSFHKS